MKFPTRVVICGKKYRVIYTVELVDTDVDGRDAVWGQADFHGRVLRVYAGKGEKKRQPADVLETLLHEMVHVILEENKAMKALVDPSRVEEFVDNLGVQVADTLTRNGFIRLQGD